MPIYSPSPDACRKDCSSPINAYATASCIREVCWGAIVEGGGVDVLEKAIKLLQECREEFKRVASPIQLQQVSSVFDKAKRLCDFALRYVSGELPTWEVIERLRRVYASLVPDPPSTLMNVILRGEGRAVEILDDIIEIFDVFYDPKAIKIPPEYRRYSLTLKEAVDEFLFKGLVNKAFGKLMSDPRVVSAVLLHRMISEATLRRVKAEELKERLEALRDDILSALQEYIESVVVGLTGGLERVSRRLEELSREVFSLETGVKGVYDRLSEVIKAIQDDKEDVARSLEAIRDSLHTLHEQVKGLASIASRFLEDAKSVGVDEFKERLALLNEAWRYVQLFVDELRKASGEKKLVVSGMLLEVHEFSGRDFGVIRVADLLLRERRVLGRRYSIHVRYVAVPKLDQPEFITLCQRLPSYFEGKVGKRLTILVTRAPVPQKVAEHVKSMEGVVVVEMDSEPRIIAKPDPKAMELMELVASLLPLEKLTQAIALKLACTLAKPTPECSYGQQGVSINEIKERLRSIWWFTGIVDKVVEQLPRQPHVYLQEHGVLCIDRELCE